ncbi:MAG: S4 domain-containing protein [Methylococcaceae bacterium]|nr:S4 domain-containing protein [Methylococcaceae bacterium]
MSSRAKDAEELEDRLRLDKWLWAARFFKTRSLATEAINGGKIHLNGQKVKPGKEISVGARLEISKDQSVWEVVVTALNAQRRPAKEAAMLYQETPESLIMRQAEMERRRLERESGIQVDQRPDKKGRRAIHRFKRDMAGS